MRRSYLAAHQVTMLNGTAVDLAVTFTCDPEGTM